MAVIAESKTEILVFKKYVSATIDATAEPDLSTTPGATSAQVLRHVDHNLSFAMENFRPNEKRQDGQRPMGSAGTGQLSGSINGFLSPGTHRQLFEGVFRNTFAVPLTLDYTDFTSIAFDEGDSTMTFAAGDPVASGLRVGMYVKPTGISGANLNKWFLILGFGGSSNREVDIYPAPADMMADTSFEIVTSALLTNHATTLTSMKYAFEWYNTDADFSRLATECRMGGFDLSAPVNQNVGLNFNVMGRNLAVRTAGDAPYFTSPTAETTTDIPSSMAGLVHLNGSVLAVSTTSGLRVNLNPQAAKAKNADGLVQGIFLEDFMAEGDFTAFATDGALMTAYRNKTEMKYFEDFPNPDGDRTKHAQCFFAPRIRLTSCTEVTVDGGKAFQCSFELGRYAGSEAGVNSTTLQIADTAILS